jgi:hypothetical protein
VDIFYSGGGLAAMKSAAPKLGDEGRLNAMFDKYAGSVIFPNHLICQMFAYFCLLIHVMFVIVLIFRYSRCGQLV